MTGTLLVRADGTSCGASMVKMSADFPNEAARCQRFLSERAQRNFEPRDGNGPAATRSPCYLMQNTRSKDRVRGTNSVKRAVAQLGRTPGSGRLSSDFLKSFRLTLTCLTLGKSGKPLDLTHAQITLKNFHRWIKRWIKLEHPYPLNLARFPTGQNDK